MPTTQLTDRYASRVRILKALAHPTRLFLVEELAGGPRCVCELTERIGDDISTVSKHLALLRDAGVLSSERRGQQIFYRLRVPCVLEIFGCVEGVLSVDGTGARSCRVAN
jgi:DNA-binding transcriptional ArsR family regulator